MATHLRSANSFAAFAANLYLFLFGRALLTGKVNRMSQSEVVQRGQNGPNHTNTYSSREDNGQLLDSHSNAIMNTRAQHADANARL